MPQSKPDNARMKARRTAKAMLAFCEHESSGRGLKVWQTAIRKRWRLDYFKYSSRVVTVHLDEGREALVDEVTDLILENME